MAEFCEPCPLKGSCEGPIKQVILEDMYGLGKFNKTTLIGRYAVAFNAANQPSEPVPYSSAYDMNIEGREFEHRIDSCAQPKTRLLPFLRPKDCGAFTEEIRPYEATPGVIEMSKETFIARITQKYLS